MRPVANDHRFVEVQSEGLRRSDVSHASWSYRNWFEILPSRSAYPNQPRESRSNSVDPAVGRTSPKLPAVLPWLASRQQSSAKLRDMLVHQTLWTTLSAY